MCLLGDDMEIDVRGFGHKLLNGEIVKVFAQAVQSRSADNGLGDALLANIGRGDASRVASCEVHDRGTEVFCELQAGFEGALTLRDGVAVTGYVKDVELGGESFGEAGAACDEIAGLGVGADAYGDLFGNGPVSAEPLTLDVVIERAIDGAGDALEGHFAQSDEIAAAEEVGKRTLDALHGVDIAAAHAGDESFGSEVADDDFVGAVEHPVRNQLADADASEGLDARGEAFDVLNVDGAEDVDLIVEEEQDVFVALGEAAAFDVGVGKLVDEHDLRHSCEDAIDVHLGEDGAFVIDVAAGDLFELGGELGGIGAAMGFDDADDDVFATAAAANAFAEHAEGFADAWRVSEKNFEAAALLLRLAREEPVFRRFSILSHAVQFS